MIIIAPHKMVKTLPQGGLIRNFKGYKNGTLFKNFPYFVCLISCLPTQDICMCYYFFKMSQISLVSVTHQFHRDFKNHFLVQIDLNFFYTWFFGSICFSLVLSNAMPHEVSDPVSKQYPMCLFLLDYSKGFLFLAHRSWVKFLEQGGSM